MEKLSFQEIVEAVHGKVIINNNIHKYNYVSTDTRKISTNSIFIALKGENFNGNDYIGEASNKGANLCIVDEIKFQEEDLKEYTSVIKVEDARKALLDLAEYYRNTLDIKIIGITGSTGKTSTKDLTAAALSSKFKVFKTKGNFNNEIGLPLMIFELDNSYDVAVLEMGMSNFDEIHRLAKTARPDIAIITNIGISHIENLKTRENILKAKMEITDFFTDKSTLIVNNDNDLLSTLKEENYKLIKIGFDENSDYKAENIELGENYIKFSLKHDNMEGSLEEFKIDVPGKHNILNSLLAIATGRALEIDYSRLKQGIKKLEATSMRLDIVKCSEYTVIDDCYNASPDSMRAALDVMKTLKGKRRIAILGTMKELGDESHKAHKEIGNYASEIGIDKLFVVGEYNSSYKEGFNDNDNFAQFKDNQEIIKYLDGYLQDDDIVLVKASRSMKFEEIIKKLKLDN